MRKKEKTFGAGHNKVLHKKLFPKLPPPPPPPEQQNMIWSSFKSKPPDLRKQVLCERMTLSKCKYQMKGKSSKVPKEESHMIEP